MIRLIALAAIAASAVAASPPGRAQDRPNESRDMMRRLGAGMDGEALREAIVKAERSPLGSRENPVRENGPEGERSYLAKLRCPGGASPSFDRAGNVGMGPYRFIVDLYRVKCPGEEPVDVHIDMYHDGGETRPVPGFSIVD